MNDKVIPFPQSAPASPQPVIEPQSRIIMHIGKQRFALDITCRATVLNPVPVAERQHRRTAAAARYAGRQGRKERQSGWETGHAVSDAAALHSA